MIPLHIVEKIGVYAKPPPRWPYTERETSSSRHPYLTRLLVLMNVSRLWRESVCPRFYQEALLRITNVDRPSKLKIPLVNGPMTLKYQTHIRELTIEIDISAFIMTQSPETLFADCNILPTVKCVAFEFQPDFDKLPESAKHGLAKADMFPRVIRQNMHTISERIREIAPNACEFAFQLKRQPGHMSLEFSSIDFYITDNLNMLLPLGVDGLYSFGLSLPETMLDNTGSAGLRVLEMAYTQTGGHELELAMRFSQSLERLCIRGLREQNLSSLIVDTHQTHFTRVFPQLKSLVIADSYSPRPNDMPQIQVNPFPRLETLICTGIFPFNSALVFHGGRTRFRHLDIELDSTIMHALLLTSVLDKGTFWGLNYVRLGWVHGDRRGYTLEYAQKLVKAAIELCPNTRILKTFVRMGYDAFEDVCAAEFPRYLEHLDIKYVMLDIDQLVLLLGRLKHLRSLVTGFNCCLECPENGVASNRHIRELQQRLQGTVVGVWAVSINASGYRHFAKAAESAVLLADILPNVTRMSLLSTSHNLTNELQIIDGIRQRPVYLNNERLAQVEFSILCVWTNEPLQRGWGLNN